MVIVLGLGSGGTMSDLFIRVKRGMTLVMTLLVYVAGPYRAKTTWDINCNIHKARVWGAALAKCGAYPIIPHSNTAHFDGIAEDKLWLDGTLELLSRCDAAIFIDGWRESSGSKAEWERAKMLRIPVLDVDGWSNRGGSNVNNDLRDWLAKNPKVASLHDTESPI